MTRHRLLLLSVGSQVGQSVLRTLSARRDSLDLMATSSTAQEPSLFDFDAVYLVPRTAADPEGFERQLLEIMVRERIDLVMPCRDDDVLLLSSLRDRRPDLAPRLLCGNAAMAQVIADKWLSYEFSMHNALPFAASMIRCAAPERIAFVRKYGFPLVAKPRRGYASLDVFMLHKDEQVEAMLGRDGCIVQQFLGDPRPIVDYLVARG
jgi:carbamoyl-phosphate synthase large subunit